MDLEGPRPAGNSDVEYGLLTITLDPSPRPLLFGKGEGARLKVLVPTRKASAQRIGWHWELNHWLRVLPCFLVNDALRARTRRLVWGAPEAGD